MGRTSPPHNPLGQLQRGRGAGWLAASNSTNGSDLLLECIACDPRTDSQVEERADYYGSLARALKLSAAAVAAAPIEDIDNARALRLDVLAAMARRGDVDAIDLLRELYRADAGNQHLAYRLSELPGGLDGMDQVIASRLNRDALAELVDWTRTMLPWDLWAITQPLIAAAVSQYDAKSMPSSPAPPDLDASLDVILAHDWRGQPPAAAMRRLIQKPTADEIVHLRKAATGPSSLARYFSLHILGERRDPCALDLAEKTFATNTRGRDRATLYRYIRALDSNDALPLARRWLGVDDSRSGVAATLLAMHSEASDVPSIRSALDRAWNEQSYYELCSLIEALGRHPAGGPYEELRTIYAEVDYSYARKRAAAAMSRVDADFVRLFARECLWDCEPETQVTGVETADIAAAETINRIRYLATSAIGDRDVALAAAARLNRFG